MGRSYRVPGPVGRSKMAKVKILKSYELEVIKRNVNEEILNYHLQIEQYNREIKSMQNRNAQEMASRIDNIGGKIIRLDAWIEASRNILIKIEQYATEIEI